MKLDIERVHELLLGLCTGLNKVITHQITTTQLNQQMNEHLPKTMTSYYIVSSLKLEMFIP